MCCNILPCTKHKVVFLRPAQTDILSVAQALLREQSRPHEAVRGVDTADTWGQTWSQPGYSLGGGGTHSQDFSKEADSARILPRLCSSQMPWADKFAGGRTLNCEDKRDVRKNSRRIGETGKSSDKWETFYLGGWFIGSPAHSSDKSSMKMKKLELLK
jgi:hypothetical protein